LKKRKNQKSVNPTDVPPTWQTIVEAVALGLLQHNRSAAAPSARTLGNLDKIHRLFTIFRENSRTLRQPSRE